MIAVCNKITSDGNIVVLSCSVMSNSLQPHGLCVARQAPLSMGFCRQEYWSGLLCPPPGDLPKPGIELASLVSPALAGEFFTTSTTWEAYICMYGP